MSGENDAHETQFNKRKLGRDSRERFGRPPIHFKPPLLTDKYMHLKFK